MRLRRLGLVGLIGAVVWVLSGCTPWVDNFQGTAINYYLQNDTSRSLSYELVHYSSEIICEGVVEVGEVEKIAWTRQAEVSWYPFRVVKVYDGERLVVEAESSTIISEEWVVERVEYPDNPNNLHYTLVLTEEML